MDEAGPRPRRLHSSTQWFYGLVLTLAVVGLFGVVAAMSFWAERRPAPRRAAAHRASGVRGGASGADRGRPPPLRSR